MYGGNKILAALKPTTCPLDTYPLWLVKACSDEVWVPLREIINLSLLMGTFLEGLKEAIVCPLLKKTYLDPTVLTNYCPESNLPFLGKVVERTVVTWL